MKKCPYCAEEIQDEAIVCRFCGRDLITPKETVIQEPPKPAQKSIWQASRTAVIVITVLYVINTFITAPTQSELVGRLTLGLLATFFGWWVICALIVWIWRKKYVLPALLLIVVGVALVLVFENQDTFQSPSITRTPTPRRTPTRSTGFQFGNTPTPEIDCFLWSEISDSMIGQDICVYGEVASVSSDEGIATRIEFSSEPNTFFLLSSTHTFDGLRIGDCIVADDTVLTYGDVLYMNIGENLYRCQ